MKMKQKKNLFTMNVKIIKKQHYKYYKKIV